MKFCSSCGATVALEVELCPRCGDIADASPLWIRIPHDRIVALEAGGAAPPAER